MLTVCYVYVAVTFGLFQRSFVADWGRFWNSSSRLRELISSPQWIIKKELCLQLGWVEYEPVSVCFRRTRSSECVECSCRVEFPCLERKNDSWSHPLSNKSLAPRLLLWLSCSLTAEGCSEGFSVWPFHRVGLCGVYVRLCLECRVWLWRAVWSPCGGVVPDLNIYTASRRSAVKHIYLSRTSPKVLQKLTRRI